MEGTVKDTFKDTTTEVTIFNNTIQHLELCLLSIPKTFSTM